MNFLKRPALLILACLLGLASCITPEPDCDPEQHDLSTLAGEWIRVLSNNPSNDGMEVTVIGDEGVVSDQASSGFGVGSVKWRNIVSDGQGGFDYQELGSDGNYYEATMDIQEDSIFISIVSSGAGNSQKYVKKESYTDPGPSAETIILDCSGISAPTTWENGAAAVDYVVQSGCVIDITDVLTIEPGTVIQFEENSGLGIYDNGALKAVGTSSLPIVLEGKDNVRGYWRGIHIETNTLNNQLDHVTIANAGANYVYCCNTPASLFLKGGTLSIKNTTIRGGLEYGLFANGDSRLREYENVTITEHSENPLNIHIERATELDGLGSDYTGNERPYILVQKSNADDPTTLPANNVPYLFDATVVNVTDAMTIEAGVEIAFLENGGIGVTDNGSLKINGTASNPVLMRGREASKGFWRGIHMETNSINNQFQHLEIRDAGSDYVYCCNDVGSIFVKDGKLGLQNVSISNGGGYGIVTKKDAVFNGFEAVNITTHDRNPLYITMTQAASLDGNTSSFSGNTFEGIAIYRNEVSSPITLKEQGVPYRIVGNVVVDVTAALTLDPGVIIEFENTSGLGIYDNGVLNAVGRADKKIIFRGTQAQNGYWRGIQLETNSPDNIMDHVEIRHAGGTYVYCCNSPAGFLLKGGRMTLTNSYIADNDGCGVRVASGGTLTESGNTFANNTDGHICN